MQNVGGFLWAGLSNMFHPLNASGADRIPAHLTRCAADYSDLPQQVLPPITKTGSYEVHVPQVNEQPFTLGMRCVYHGGKR